MSSPTENIFFTGDTVELQFQLFKNKSNNEYWDVSGAKIKFELHLDGVSIKKATSNVVGGGDEQIHIIDAESGSFLVVIPAVQTQLVAPREYNFQIQIITADNKVYTVIQDTIRLIEALIKWDSI